MAFNIAIDGPAGAGKSTVARRVAKELSFIYVDTGAMYRAMALYFFREGIPPEDEDAVRAACKDVNVSIASAGGEQQVFLNGENVTGLIREEKIGDMASIISAYGEVRKKLTQLQRDLAESTDLVMDGRDIGTSVLPGAQVKVYLTASVDVRGERRFLELQEKGVPCSLERICEDIRARDEKDMGRAISPLRQAEDAVRIDSSDMSIEEVTERIVALARKGA